VQRWRYRSRRSGNVDVRSARRYVLRSQPEIPAEVRRPVVKCQRKEGRKMKTLFEPTDRRPREGQNYCWTVLEQGPPSQGKINDMGRLHQKCASALRISQSAHRSSVGWFVRARARGGTRRHWASGSPRPGPCVSLFSMSLCGIQCVVDILRWRHEPDTVTA
jgi:hypothetical protein